MTSPRFEVTTKLLSPSTIDETAGSSRLSLGCYEDDPDSRVLDELVLSDGSMTTEVIIISLVHAHRC